MNADTPSGIAAGAQAPPAAPQRRRRRRVTRRLGLFSAPAALLALCAAMAAAYVWGLAGAMAQVLDDAPDPSTLGAAREAALMAFPVLTPLVLIAVHRAYWRLMRPWLKIATRALLGLWALATALMGYALL